ncbi:hypothetical protein G9A89_018026 [Geosiphon pyriformis]|nr:hypothetical protein G9A89_018026 [Geosiphon pyriformis]
MVKKTRSSEKWEQLLASAIITPNPFVVLNKILDKISIISSGTLFKMGQDQPLAVLPNVVSSGRLSSVVEAKQSPLVGLSVLGNWTDQMETDSSPPLVSGATSGGAWETITSCQRFAGWVVSTLVLSATFKIKLAYVKTVFQFVYGFLGAKSVSKNNVKLFCVGFASQQSLEATFLVELTSSVHLTTLKIAKSLVVSESGSSPAAVALCDVPLGVSAADIKLAFSVFGSIIRVVLKPAGIWQYMVVYFEKLDSAVSALKHWSVLMDKDSVRILLLVNQNETILSCDKFKAKLVNLPLGCTAFEISNMISQIGGQTCFISRSSDSGHCFRFALVTFDSQGDLNSAVVKTGHLAVDCKISPPSTPKVPKVFKSHFVGGVSYAKAFAFLDSSEFPPLAASTFSSMVVGDSLVSSQLASLESDLVKLFTLVESIVKPVGFLVKLFEQFINENLVSSSKLGLKINEVMVHMGSFSKIVGKLEKEVVFLKKECCMENINMFGNLEHLVGLDDEVFSNLLSLWEHESIDVKADALKTVEWLVGLVFCSVTLFLVIQKISFLVISLHTPLFMIMDPVGSSAGGSASGLAGVGTHSGTKKKMCIESVYTRGPSYKKAKKPDNSGVVVDSSAGPLPVDMLHGGIDNQKKSWGSEMDSEESSIGRTSDVENMKNTIVEETSYIDSNTSGNDKLMGNTTLKGLRTRTYVFEHLSKQPSFVDVGGADDILELPPRTFNGSNQLLPVASRDREIWSFISVKSFALDIELSAVPGKTVSDKLICVKKIFYQVDGFGGASTLSKFPGIIRSSFTSEKSLIKAREMAISEKFLVNDDLRKVNNHSDRGVIIKEIPVDLPKSAIEAVFSKFGKIISIKVQLIGLWQKALVEYESSEIADLVMARWSMLMGKNFVRVAKTSHWALLYTLPVGTTAYDLFALVKAYGGKTCFIGRNPSSYIHDRCAVICFESEASKLAAIGSVLVFKSVSLCWTGLSLACCVVCKQFGHVSNVCSMSENSGARSKQVVTSQNWVCLANVYRKKQTPITHPVSFGGKTWAQVASGTSFHVVSLGFFSVGASFDAGSASVESSPSDISGLCNRLAILERSLELLADQVSAIVKKLSCVEVVSSKSSSLASHPIASASLALCVDLDITLDVPLVVSPSLCPTVDDANPDFGSSSSKVLTAKVGGLESKLMALDALIGSVLARLDMLCSGLGSSVLSSSQ